VVRLWVDGCPAGPPAGVDPPHQAVWQRREEPGPHFQFRRPGHAQRRSLLRQHRERDPADFTTDAAGSGRTCGCPKRSEPKPSIETPPRGTTRSERLPSSALVEGDGLSSQDGVQALLQAPGPHLVLEVAQRRPEHVVVVVVDGTVTLGRTSSTRSARCLASIVTSRPATRVPPCRVPERGRRS
jgi:hypothetical protein